MIIYHDDEQGSPSWFKKREGKWSGSKALRLLQGKRFKDDAEWGGNDYTRRGHALEVAAIREYERKFRCKVFRPGGVTNTVYPNAWYSPDGLDRRWLLECKALTEMRHQGLISDKMPLDTLEGIIASKIPLLYKAQIFFGMIITGKRKARLLAFNPEIPDQEQLMVVEIGYDKLIGNNIRSKLRLDLKQRSSG